MKTELVNVEGKNVFTTSLIIAEECRIGHETVLNHVRNHKNRFEKLGPLRFEIDVAIRKQGGGTALEYAILNEDHAMVLITMLRNTEIVLDFKFALVVAFRKAINELHRIEKMRLTIDWQEARANGKCIRNVLTDVVKIYEKHADKQGGVKLDQHGNNVGRHYYSTITKMIYKELFGDRKLKNVRDKLDSLKLQFLSICEQACADELEKMVELELEYHDIYQECRKRVISTVEGLSATRLNGEESDIKLVWDKQTGVKCLIK